MDYLGLQARLQPHRLAAADVSSGRRWSYAGFEEAVGKFAGALFGFGVGGGDRVAVLAKNCVELVLLHFACARVGAIFVPLNWRLAAAELAVLVADAEPVLVLGDFLLAAAGLEGLALDEFLRQAEGCAPLPYPGSVAGAASLMLYTSGTSGRPKGVLISEENAWATGFNFSMLARVTHESRVLCEAPMFHVMGMVTNVRPVLMRGGAILVSDGFEAGRTLERLGDVGLGVTHYFCVPQVAAMLRAHEAFELARLKGLVGLFSGGAPHAAEVVRTWVRDGVAVADGYGMTEVGTVSCMPVDLGCIEAKAGSAGVVAPWMEVRILDAAGAPCPAGELGEICLRGASVAKGYWRRPAETAAAFDAQGWFKSGDIGRVDEEGYLWVVDRKKDMFISGGENVYPAEIEGVMAGMEGVMECAVVGVADERWGEVGHLVVVAKAGVDEGGVRGFLEGRVARYKMPKYVSFMEALPRNGAGKLVKGALRGVLAGG